MPDAKMGPPPKHIEVLSFSWGVVNFSPGEPPRFTSTAEFSDGSSVEASNVHFPAWSLAFYHAETAAQFDFEPFDAVVTADDGTVSVAIFAVDDGDLIFEGQVDAVDSDIIFGGLGQDDLIGGHNTDDFFLV
jgi:hypothetical protein